MWITSAFGASSAKLAPSSPPTPPLPPKKIEKKVTQKFKSRQRRGQTGDLVVGKQRSYNCANHARRNTEENNHFKKLIGGLVSPFPPSPEIWFSWMKTCFL